jgi:aspartate carbamoyltransferase regulatory subunit
MLSVKTLPDRVERAGTDVAINYPQSTEGERDCLVCEQVMVGSWIVGRHSVVIPNAGIRLYQDESLRSPKNGERVPRELQQVLLNDACEVSCRDRAVEGTLRHMAMPPQKMVPPLLIIRIGQLKNMIERLT